VTTQNELVVFNDKALEARHAAGRIPMTTLFEAYLDGEVDIPDMDAFLDARDRIVTYSLTMEHVKQLVTRMIPEWTIHSMNQDKRIVREHYDRGNDFFEAFLGDRMVYTAGFFTKSDESETLEQAQDNKIDLVCRKLMTRPGDELLDIGCGWGTLAMYSAKHFGVKSTGITIAEKQTEFGNARIAKAGLSDKAKIECLDYRALPNKQFDRIVSLEMVEHVGIKNLAKYFDIVRDHLKDDGLFLLQFCGLRRGADQGVPPVGLRAEDMIWGLFMNKYIFPGADASLPLSDMCKYMEKAGFDIHSAENISIHYSVTIKRWHDNWMKNKPAILAAYGERWYRMWHLFLAWSWRIGAQGNSECFQIVAHKNLDHFNRKIFIGQSSLGQVKPLEKDSRERYAAKNGTAHAE
jgi:cyclopropane fatty-acyl-phospholipid synthase-like methyltransferase